MVEAIKTRVIEIDLSEIELEHIIPIHPDAKYVIVCGEIDVEKNELLAQSLSEWYSDPDSPFAILMGDYMLVRVDKLPPHIADALEIFA